MDPERLTVGEVIKSLTLRQALGVSATVVAVLTGAFSLGWNAHKYLGAEHATATMSALTDVPTRTSDPPAVPVEYPASVGSPLADLAKRSDFAERASPHDDKLRALRAKQGVRPLRDVENGASSDVRGS